MLVNPYSAEDMADAIAAALAMPRAERIERWQRMMRNIRDEDVLWWRRRFTDVLAGAGAEPEKA